jgi:hypothetical protein
VSERAAPVQGRPETATGGRAAAQAPPTLAGGQASAGMGALLALGATAGNRAVAAAVQRRVIPTERDWLRALLTSRDQGFIARTVANSPDVRLRRMAVADRNDTINDVRGEIDGFEIALGAAFPFTHERSCRLVSLLEAAQPNEALGLRLVTLFRASADPLIGLALLIGLEFDRTRAVIQGRADGLAAVDAVLARVPIARTPSHLRRVRRGLVQLATEMRNPDVAGVSASSPARERRVETMLTPPEIRARRAAAVAAGLDPAAAVVFQEAGYYDHLIGAVHLEMKDDWGWAEPMDARTRMDTRPGGHVEGIATEAKTRVDALFGRYGSAAAPSLRFGRPAAVGRPAVAGNLHDQTATAGNPADLVRWYIFDSGRDRVNDVKDAHNAFASDRANELGRHVIGHYTGTAVPGAPAPAGLDATLDGMNAAERVRRLRVIDRMWPGMAGGGHVFINTREGADAAETRAQYWGLFKTLIHEYLHTTANGTYTTWYEGLTDPHQKIVFQEGFTDLFTLQTWRSVFPDHITTDAAFRRRIQGDITLDLAAVGGNPGHYDEMADAQNLERQIGLANMRAGYFRGNTAVLGGARLPR